MGTVESVGLAAQLATQLVAAQLSLVSAAEPPATTVPSRTVVRTSGVAIGRGNLT
jgi:hypothetical protein